MRKSIAHNIEIRLDGKPSKSLQERIEIGTEAQGGYTAKELSDAFDAVKDADHWKNPIDAIVERSMWDVLSYSIPYYTGTPADYDDVEGRPEMIRVFAPGYFAGPCN